MNGSVTPGAYLIIDHIVPAPHLLADSRLQEIQDDELGRARNARQRRTSPALDFHGVEPQIDLVGSVQKLLRLIRLRWLPVLQAFVEDKSLVELATRRYIRFLQLCSEQSKISRSATYHNVRPAKTHEATTTDYSVPSDDFTYVIWLCHMIDSWAYYNDCMNLCDGNLIEHRVIEDVDRYRLASTASPYPVPDIRANLSIQMDEAVQWLYGMCRTFSLPHFSDSKFQHNAIKRYYCFLGLLRSYPCCFATMPRPSDIMLAWMAHSLHPRIFRQDVRLMLGPSSKVLLDRLQLWPSIARSQAECEALWLDLFKSNLLLPGTLHRPLLPHDILSRCSNFPEVLKPDLTLRVHFNGMTRLPNENWFVDTGDRELRPVQAGLTYEIPCFLDRFPLRVRVGSWPQVKWMVIGFIDLPFHAITTNTLMGGQDIVSWTGEYFRIILHERPYGPRPLPAMLAKFLEVPSGQIANLVMLTSSIKVAGTGLSIHFLPELTTLFMFVGGLAPIVVCKVVSSMFLPRASQLNRPDIFPHMEEDSVGLIVHDRFGEQLLFIANRNDRNSPLMAVVLNPKLKWKETAKLPICSRIVNSQTGLGGLEVRFSHENLFSPSFPMLLCVSLALHLLKISDNSRVQAFSAALDNTNFKKLDDRGVNGITRSKSSRSVHVNTSNTVGFDF